MDTINATDKLRYHLRFQIVPRNVPAGHDARALAAFCTKHRIEEVVLFYAAEEWNNGLLSADEETEWFEVVRATKSVLDDAGIAVSLNPWMTALHTDRGREFPTDRQFSPMISPLGEVSEACASFADPEWQRYCFDQYARFAELGFRVLWVEDDFRFHNHAPLTWGCGFEPEVIERFERKAGCKATREEIVADILKSGAPHEWRAIWMETWREVHLEVATGLSEAVERAAPGASRLGLMSSHPSSHSTEGRDWSRLFDALSIDGAVTHRPHFAGYSESTGKGKANSIMMLDVQRLFRPDTCEVAPEIENFPFTQWNKSDTQTWSEMALCMFHGSDALLLDVFPFSGNSVDEETEVGDMLDASRPALEWIASRFSSSLSASGVALPWVEDAQAHVRTKAGASLDELDATSFGPGHLLLPYGVPVSASDDGPSAVFGSLAWAFDDSRIESMLASGLMLDGASAEILCERGYGALLGVDWLGMMERDSSRYSLELTTNDECGVRAGVYLNANVVPRFGLMEPTGAAREWTAITTPTKERLGAAIVAFENDLGGRVVTFAAPEPDLLAMSNHRQRIVHRAARYLYGDAAPGVLVTGGPHLMPMDFAGNGDRKVVVACGSTDPTRPVIRVNGASEEPSEVTLLRPLGRPEVAACEVDVDGDGVTVRMLEDVPYHGYVVPEW